MRADIPGIKPEEVKIEVEDDILTVSGGHEESKEERTSTYCGASAATGPSSRSMALPAGVDAKKIKAKTQDGVVEVTIRSPRRPRRRGHTELGVIVLVASAGNVDGQPADATRPSPQPISTDRLHAAPHTPSWRCGNPPRPPRARLNVAVAAPVQAEG